MARAAQPDRSVTAFNEALWKHDDATIARLTSSIDPNALDRWQRAPLAMAAQYGDATVVKRLLARGAHPDAGRTLLTPLTHAARRGATDILDALRAAGATPSILTAIYLDDRSSIERALTHIAATTLDEDDTPLLLHAAQSLHVDMVELLLDAGANIACTDRFGETALHRVADLRPPEADPARVGRTASLLLDRGADVDARNRDDVTPLHQAVRARNLAAVEVLLVRGADVNARDKRGSTPLHRAVSGTGAGGTAGADAAPIIAALLASGADADQRDGRGRSARAAAKPGALGRAT